MRLFVTPSTPSQADYLYLRRAADNLASCSVSIAVAYENLRL